MNAKNKQRIIDNLAKIVDKWIRGSFNAQKQVFLATRESKKIYDFTRDLILNKTRS